MTAVVLAGAAAYFKLAVAALPEVDYPTIEVHTFYPGASPDVVASGVTAPLERQLGEIPGLTQLASVSSDGSSSITLQFALALNIDVAEQEVQAAINSAQSYLPTDLPVPPVYSKSNPADAPVLTLALTSDSIPLSEVEDLADSRLAPKLSQVSGVGLVTLSGGQKPAVRIQANAAALSSYGLGMEDVRSALNAASANTAKGTLDGPQQTTQLNANDQIFSSKDYREVVVAYRDGAPVMLKDVANVADGVENTRLAAWSNHRPAVLINIRRQPGANTIKVVEDVKALVPQLTATLPAAVNVTTLTDRTTTIRASVADVQFELCITISLVILVIFLFLRNWRATIIPAVAIPISLVGTLAVMYLLGYSLNNLTLMALTIATGFVVDDAIVMVENISRLLEEGHTPMVAALEGAEQIGFTIVSLTVSLIAVLIPLLFMGDVVGRLFREFAVTLAVSIAISAAVSLSLTPMMSARLLRHDPALEQGPFYRWSENVFERVIASYARTLRVVLRHQRVVLALSAAVLAVAIALYAEVPKGLFPTQDTGLLQGITQAPESTSFTVMSTRQQELADLVLKDPAVESLSSSIGVDGTNATLNSGRMQINLKPYSTRHMDAAHVSARIMDSLRGVAGIQLSLQPVQDLTVENRATRAQYQFTLNDADPVELKVWADRLMSLLAGTPQLRNVSTDAQPNGLGQRLLIDRLTASRLNITPQQIDATLYDLFGQRQVATLYTQFNQYHVILEGSPTLPGSTSPLDHIYLQGGSSTSSTQSGGSSNGRTASSSNSGSLSTLSPASAPQVSAGISILQSNTAGSNGLTYRSGNVLSANGPLGVGAYALQAESSGAMTTDGPSPAGAGHAGATTGSAASSSPTTSGGSATTAQGFTATPVPLSSIAHFEATSTPLTIAHQGQFPVVTLSFDLAPGISLSQGVAAFDAQVKSLNMPASVQGDFQGSAVAYLAVGGNEALLILAALITVYIVLGVLYENFFHPFTILSTLPSAGIGALLALRLFGQDLGVIAIIGIVLLIGIVKKNGIMIVDFALDAERARGLSHADAIYEASLLRFRPILMTTLAALFGGIPLALGSGVGSELRRPLGIAMVGGLLLSQVLTLYTTPVIYIFFARVSQRFTRRVVPQHGTMLAGQI